MSRRHSTDGLTVGGSFQGTERTKTDEGIGEDKVRKMAAT